MSARAWSLALVLPLAIVAPGCVRACTAMGAFEGVLVGVPVAVHDEPGRVTATVCDADGCVTGSDPLGRRGGAEVREVALYPADLGRPLVAGEATVTVELVGSDGRPLAVAERDVVLEASYPNGEDCDGDGFVSATVELTAADRVGRPRP